MRPSGIAEIGRRVGAIGRVRAVVGREGERDVLTVRCETESFDPSLSARVGEAVQEVLRVRGVVELVKPGSLPNDGLVIADERTYDE